MKWSLITLAAAALLRCAFPANAEELSPARAAQARTLYLAKCAKCHDLYDPRAYNEVDWQRWMIKMKKKSKLKNDQFELLTNYLSNVRSRSP